MLAQEKPFAARKSHRKSRTGCTTCKQRRVKCDETRPKCTACARRSLPCSFEDSLTAERSSAPHSRAASNASSPARVTTEVNQYPTPESPAISSHTPGAGLASGTPGAPRLDAFDILDMELMHHFSAEVSRTVAEDGKGLDVWRHRIPTIAFEHSYTLHALLAVSALHMARTDPKRRAEWLSRANQHHALTLAPMIETLPLLCDANAAPLWVTSTLLCFHNFGRGPQPGQYIAFSDEGEAEWMWLLRGVRLIMTVKRPYEMMGYWSEGHLNPKKSTSFSELGDAVEGLRSPVPGYKEPLDKLLRFANTMLAEDASFSKYTTAITQLHECFIETFVDDAHPSGSAWINSHKIFAWLFRMESDFVVSLQDKKPLALIVFAHFNVLLHLLRVKWYLEGWSWHVMNGIYRHLHPDYRDWLKWPAEILEWSPH